MQLTFDSIEELKTFVASLKGTRGKKGDDDAVVDEGARQGVGQAPPPLQPPQQQPAFQPPQQQQPAFSPPASFPGSAPGIDPAVAAIVARITARMDGAVSSGETKVEDMLAWFRGQAGAEAANATIDQIKQHFLPKMAMPTLENIAKLMSA